MLRNGSFWPIVVSMAWERLTGEYDHTVDDKGRVTLPARYRPLFVEKAVIAHFPNRPYLSVYQPDAWVEFEARTIDPLDTFNDDDDEWTMRDIYSNMSEPIPDKQGRILLTARLLERLGLSGDVKIVAMRDHFEIWNPETYARAREARESA
jgi:MraZ protein